MAKELSDLLEKGSDLLEKGKEMFMANEQSDLLAKGQSQVTTAQVSLAVNYVTGDLIALSYHTLSGNQPNTFGNVGFIWQNFNQIPWSVDPLNQQNIPTNTTSGSMNFTDLEITKNSYVIGYAVGPDVSNICASAFVPAGSDQSNDPSYQYDAASLTLKFVGTDSVAVGYHTLAGYQPRTQNNWLGMWQNTAASYTTPPQWKTGPSGDSPNGTASFNNVPIVRDSAYTIAYFMGRKQTMMAATLTFTT